MSGRRGGQPWTAFICILAVGLATLSAASAAEAEFGFQGLGVSFFDEVGAPVSQAGSHPYAWSTSFDLNSKTDAQQGVVPDGEIKDLKVQLPPGLVGTPALIPRCSQADLLAEACPAASQVGTIALRLDRPVFEGSERPLYNLQPPPGFGAAFGFLSAQEVPIPVALGVRIKPDPPHNLVVSLTNISQAKLVFGAVLTLWGTSEGPPLFTLPRRCSGPLVETFEASSWQHPEAPTVATTVTVDNSTPPNPIGLTGCDALDFTPTLTARPTSDIAGGAAGLDVEVEASVQGLTSMVGTAQADIRKAVLRLPEGMAVNAPVAAGLGACTPADYARESVDPAADGGCPADARIGSARVLSPLLGEPVEGSIFLAQPDDPVTPERGAENPFDAQLALYLIFENSRLGVLIKQPIEIKADGDTGQLTGAIDGIPELPFSSLELHFGTGSRKPLVNPQQCGQRTVGYELTPSTSAAPIKAAVAVDGAQGCAAAGFQPSLAVGTTKPVAGAPAPLVLDLRRGDGEQNLSRLSITLPPGLSADFASVVPCPDERASTGSCPMESRIGSAKLYLGAGPVPLQVPAAGRSSSDVFLGGPYKGAPFSLIVVVPGRAGPFDLGTVVVRAAIEIDPETAQSTVRLDPLPQIIRGIPLLYRGIRVEIDRPNFILNPTSCAATAASGAFVSVTGTTASSSSRFEVGRCAKLGFKPRLSLRLAGSPRRGAHPLVRIGMATRRGDAGIKRASVLLPDTELLDSARIKSVCTRARQKARRCLPGSVVGHAKAWSPLLNGPLEGPVYLRASAGRLPDLVASLDGQVQLDLVGRLDSERGRLRSTFVAMPDARLSSLALTVRGGRRGLLVNSGRVCADGLRANASLVAHNGRSHRMLIPVRTDCQK